MLSRLPLRTCTLGPLYLHFLSPVVLTRGDRNQHLEMVRSVHLGRATHLVVAASGSVKLLGRGSKRSTLRADRNVMMPRNKKPYVADGTAFKTNMSNNGNIIARSAPSRSAHMGLFRVHIDGNIGPSPGRSCYVEWVSQYRALYLRKSWRSRTWVGCEWSYVA